MSNLSKYEKLLYKHNRLKRHCGNQMNKIVEYKQELQRKDNIINELKEELEFELQFQKGGCYNRIKNLLDKIKDIENER